MFNVYDFCYFFKALYFLFGDIFGLVVVEEYADIDDDKAGCDCYCCEVIFNKTEFTLMEFIFLIHTMMIRQE